MNQAPFRVITPGKLKLDSLSFLTLISKLQSHLAFCILQSAFCVLRNSPAVFLLRFFLKLFLGIPRR